MTSIETPATPGDQGTHRALRLVIGAAAVVGLMLGVAQFSDIVGPFFLALNIMIVVWPVQRWLSRHVPRAIASIASGLLAIVILGLFFWALGWAASLFVQEIPLYKDQFQTMYDQALNMLSQFGVTSSTIIDQLKTINPTSVVSVVGSLISNVGGVVSLLVVVISVLLFMIVDSIDFQTRMERLGQRHNPVLVLALQSFAQGVRSYWVTSTIFGLGVALLTYGGLAVYGIPLAIVWAVLSFVTNYIPNVGFIIGLVPAAVMGLLAKGPFGALYVIALYAILNFVIQSVIQPKVTGDAVGVTSTVSFMSLLVWAVVLGPLGALLALPATLFIKALVVDADPRSRWINAIIASNPKTSSEEPLIDTEEVQPIDPLVPQGAPADNAGVFDVDVPRRAAEVAEQDGTDESPEDEEAAPRRSAVELEDPTLDKVAREHDQPDVEEPVVEEPVAEEPVVEEPVAEEPVVKDSVAVEAAADEPTVEGSQPDTEAVESAAATDESAPVDPEDETEDETEVPRRASADLRTEPEVEEDESEGWPVFQKSATPYWTGANVHTED
ncbi:MAG: AI-2E family transporter [Propionibacteriaceae bacterium]